MKLNRINKKILSLLFSILMITTVFAGFVTPTVATAEPLVVDHMDAFASSSNDFKEQVLALQNQNPKIGSLLEEEIAIRPHEKIPIIIVMKEPHLEYIQRFDVEKAKSLARSSQETLVSSIKQIQAVDMTQHWIINAISVKVPAEKINEIAARQDVKKVWLDAEIKLIESAITPSTTQVDYGDENINAHLLWDMGFNGTGINISILDTGIDTTHPDLDEGKVIFEKDFTGENTTDDLHGHGTHVAGIAAGEFNTTSGVSGVAYGASLFNAKVLNFLGKGFHSNIIAGIEWSVENHANVICMSLGSWQGAGDGRDPLSMAVTNAVDIHGVVVVVAAGNSGPGEGTITNPAVARGAIAVAASDSLNAITDFSSRGPTGDGRIGIDFAAPGNCIIAPNAHWEQGDIYVLKSGTSMAAPHAAGAAALLLQIQTNISSEVNKPHIISRIEWGSPDRQDSRWEPVHHPVTHIIIHHTVTPNQLPWGTDVDTWCKVVHKIWDIHALPPGEPGIWGVGEHGWGDIGYHFLIDPDGIIYEGRAGGKNAIAAHTYGHNNGTVGIAFLGTFCDIEPTSYALRSAEVLIAWICAQKNINPLTKGYDFAGTYTYFIAGRRDFHKNHISPGNKLYHILPTIRQNITNLLKNEHFHITPQKIEKALKNSADNLGYDILEQGTGRLDVKDAYHALTTGILIQDEWCIGMVSAPSNHRKSFIITNNAENDISLKINESNIVNSQGHYLNTISIEVVPSIVHIPARGTATFDAQMTISATAKSGMAIGSIIIGNTTIPVSVNIVQSINISKIELHGTVNEDSQILPTSTGDWIFYSFDIKQKVNQLNVSLTGDYSHLNDLNLYIFDHMGELHPHPERGIIRFPADGIWTIAINARMLDATPLNYTLTIEGSIIKNGYIADRLIFVPDDYSTIQKAVDAANPGDTIIVRKGNYTENIDVTTNSIIIKSESGPRSTIVQAANPNDHVFHIHRAYNVTISGFTIRGATGDRKSGISIDQSNHCEIFNNICSGNWAGIGIFRSRGNIIRNNNLFNNYYGIGISDCARACAVKEAIYRAEITAIPDKVLNPLRNFRDKELNSIYVSYFYKYSPEVTQILIEEPILLMESAKLILRYMPAVKYLLGESGYDIKMTEVDVKRVVSFITNLIDEVDEREKNIGIIQSSSIIELLKEFKYQTKASEGKTFSQAFKNSVYYIGNEDLVEQLSVASTRDRNYKFLNNFLGNRGRNARLHRATAIWRSPEPITYIFNNQIFTSHLGNFWHGYGRIDHNGDGIGDAPHISGNIRDFYPLMEQFDNFQIIPNQPPIASFTYSAEGLIVSFTTTSTDIDDNIVSYHWNFGDGGISTEKNPTNVYFASRTFTVTHTVEDKYGRVDTIIKDINVLSNIYLVSYPSFIAKGLPLSVRVETKEEMDITATIGNFSKTIYGKNVRFEICTSDFKIGKHDLTINANGYAYKTIINIFCAERYTEVIQALIDLEGASEKEMRAISEMAARPLVYMAYGKIKDATSKTVFNKLNKDDGIIQSITREYEKQSLKLKRLLRDHGLRCTDVDKIGKGISDGTNLIGKDFANNIKNNHLREFWGDNIVCSLTRDIIGPSIYYILCSQERGDIDRRTRETKEFIIIQNYTVEELHKMKRIIGFGKNVIRNTNYENIYHLQFPLGRTANPNMHYFGQKHHRASNPPPMRLFPPTIGKFRPIWVHDMIIATAQSALTIPAKIGVIDATPYDEVIYIKEAEPKKVITIAKIVVKAVKAYIKVVKTFYAIAPSTIAGGMLISTDILADEINEEHSDTINAMLSNKNNLETINKPTVIGNNLRIPRGDTILTITPDGRIADIDFAKTDVHVKLQPEYRIISLNAKKSYRIKAMEPNITIEVITDKENYVVNQTANITLKIHNNMDEPINDTLLWLILPSENITIRDSLDLYANSEIILHYEINISKKGLHVPTAFLTMFDKILAECRTSFFVGDEVHEGAVIRLDYNEFYNPGTIEIDVIVENVGNVELAPLLMFDDTSINLPLLQPREYIIETLIFNLTNPGIYNIKFSVMYGNKIFDERHADFTVRAIDTLLAIPNVDKSIYNYGELVNVSVVIKNATLQKVNNPYELKIITPSGRVITDTRFIANEIGTYVVKASPIATGYATIPGEILFFVERQSDFMVEVSHIGNTTSVYVKTDAGGGVEGANVILNNIRKITDNDGIVKFEHLNKTKFFVKVEKFGFNPIIKTIILSDIISMTITPNPITLTVTDTQQFTAKDLPVGIDQNVTWSVDNVTVGTINETGYFTALTAGIVNVTATSVVDANITGTATVTVKEPIVVPPAPESINVTPDTATLNVTGNITFTAEVLPTEADQNITWSVDNTTVGTINATIGLFTALTAGTVNVTATSVADGNITGTATITVAEVFIKGDITGDGYVRPSDALSVLRIFAGEATEADFIGANPDVNNDGYIKPTDALMILRIFAGEI